MVAAAAAVAVVVVVVVGQLCTVTVVLLQTDVHFLLFFSVPFAPVPLHGRLPPFSFFFPPPAPAAPAAAAALAAPAALVFSPPPSPHTLFSFPPP